MTVRIAGSLVILFCACVVPKAASQETKMSPRIRPAIAPDSVQLPAGDTLSGAGTSLPEFDLPEYVITGAAALDLPPAVRQLPSQELISLGPSARAGTADRRDQSAARPLQRGAEYGIVPANGWHSVLTARLGSFFSPQLRGWIGLSERQFRIGGGGEYARTKGWASYTDRSSGSFGLNGAYALTGDSPFLQDAQILGTMDYRAESYRFTGSRFPEMRREIQRYAVDLGARNLSNSEIPYAIRFGLQSFGVSDSGRSVDEGMFDIGIRSMFVAIEVPWEVAFDFSSASFGGLRRGSLSRFEVAAGARFAASSLNVHASLHLIGGTGNGPAAEDVTRVYPQVEMNIPLSAQHRVELAFLPTVLCRTLTSTIGLMPYLSAQTPLLVSDIRQHWEIDLHSDWSPRLETRLSASIEEGSKIPYPVDSLRIGIWSLAYSPAATTVTVRAEAVAKLTSNDYFGSGLVLRFFDRSDIGRKGPYEPEVEGGVVYRRRLGEAWLISPNVRFVSVRADEPTGVSRLPAVLQWDVHAEYQGVRNIRFMLDLTNVTDRRIEWWRGYPERPFSATIGLEVRW